jgi:HlyD family secretion protein
MESDQAIAADPEVTAVSRLKSLHSAEAGSDLSGKVEAVLVDVYQAVTKRQTLARLDASPFEEAIVQVKAQLASARDSLTKAKVTEKEAWLDAERKARQLEYGAATGVDVEVAGVAHDKVVAVRASAVAGVTLRGAALARGEKVLGDNAITAPIDGLVTVRLVDPGETVVSTMSATALFTVASDPKDLKAEVGVDEANVDKVAAGQQAPLTVLVCIDRASAASVATLETSRRKTTRTS